MRRKTASGCGVGLLLILCLFILQLAGCPAEVHAANLAPPAVSTSYFTPQPYLSTGFPQVVVVSGTDYEMGTQYGKQAGAAIAHNVALLKSRLYEVYGRERVTKDMQVWDYYLTKYDPTYTEWLRGIVDGCRQQGYEVSYLDLIALMVYPTEMWARPQTPYPKETGVAWGGASAEAIPNGTFHSCNTFAASGSMTPDGKPIHAITSMVEVEAMDNVILLAFPKNGNSFVCQTYAGRVGSNYAMNSKGLAWTMTAILSDTPQWGVPPEVYFHYLAQMASTTSEAIKYLESTPKGGVTGGFIFTDASGRITVYEGTANHFRSRHPGDMSEPGEFVVETNHLVHPSLRAYNPKWLPVIGTYARYDTVFQFLKEAAPGSVNFDFAKRLLASDDWYDKSTGQWRKNEPGRVEISNSHGSVSQAVFFPADLVAYLQTGTPSGLGLPAFATGEYVKIKLAADPKTVVRDTEQDTLAMYWDVVDTFRRDLNAGEAYLSLCVMKDVEDKLDQAFSAYSLGMDRASYGSLVENAEQRISLWAEAMTYYAKAQLYVQMAKTTLLKAKAGMR
ncbi:MAG: C45 family autoproteolytic acyltransferase/hydrolase [Moorellales bacterium]